MTSKETLRSWYLEGIKKAATHMVVVCDTYDHEDYPVYVHPDQSSRAVTARCNSEQMAKVMEVYNLSMDMENQLSEHRAFNHTKKEVTF